MKADASSTRTRRTTSTRTTATSTAPRSSRPAGCRRPLLPEPVDDGRLPADALRLDRRLHRAQARGHPRLRLADRRHATTWTRTRSARRRATGPASRRRATVEPLEVVRDSDVERGVATAAHQEVSTPMRSDRPHTGARVLVTGTGGPAGVAVMRALAGAPSRRLRRRHRPLRRGPLPRAEDRRGADAARRRRQHFADARSRPAASASAIDVLIPTVDSELPPLATEREPLAAAGTVLVLASERDAARRASTSGCCTSAATAAVRRARPRRSPTRRSTPPAELPGDRQAARGQRLARHPADRDARRARARRARRHAARPGAPAGARVLARRARAGRRQVVAVVPRERLKVDSGIAVTGRTRARRALEAFARATWPSGSG